MVTWHWLYRDFLRCIHTDSDTDTNVRDALLRYVELHCPILDAIHFAPKGFSRESLVRERIRTSSDGAYIALIRSIGRDYTVFESRVQVIIEHLLRKLAYAGPDQEVFIIVGLDCTNIYSTILDGKTVTVICLESTRGDMSHLELLLAHECHHWTRSTLINASLFDNCLGERMISEGLACHFSQEIQPGRGIEDYCYVPKNTIEWVVENWRYVFEAVMTNLESSQLTSILFSRDPTKRLFPDMPPRTGYVIGYILVRDFLQVSHLSSLNTVDAPWQTFIEWRGQHGVE